MLETLRQWLHPREFHIAPASLPDAVAVLADRLAELERARIAPAAGPTPGAAPADAIRPGLLADIGTGLWRLRTRMIDAATGEPPEHMRRAFRHAESIGDALAEAGVRIQDHTGIDFDPGLSLKVLAYQPVSGVQRERVIETIKPTIYLNGERIQMGEVIVGTPDVPGEPAAPSAPV